MRTKSFHWEEVGLEPIVCKEILYYSQKLVLSAWTVNAKTDYSHMIITVLYCTILINWKQNLYRVAVEKGRKGEAFFIPQKKGGKDPKANLGEKNFEKTRKPGRNPGNFFKMCSFFSVEGGVEETSQKGLW